LIHVAYLNVSCWPQPSLNGHQAIIDGWFQRSSISLLFSGSRCAEASGDSGRLVPVRGTDVEQGRSSLHPHQCILSLVDEVALVNLKS